MSENQQDMAERLRQARLAHGKYPKATEAARAMGVEEPTYLGHENGSRGFKGNASRYADFYRVNLEWLLTGRGTMRRAEASEAVPKPPKDSALSESIALPPGAQHAGSWPRDLRVLGMAECGPDGWSLWNGEVIEMTSRPPNLAGAALAYAVYVVGDSMEPRYFSGELAYVHPGRPIEIRDFVLVQVRPEKGEATPRAVIKRLIKRSGGKVTLEQYNPPKTIEVKLADIISMHQIVGSGKP